MPRETDALPRELVFEVLPSRLRFVRVIPGGNKDNACLVECGHPLDFRATLSKGPRAGHPICGICKSHDFAKTCLTIARVPPEAREPRRVAESPLQSSLF